MHTRLELIEKINKLISHSQVFEFRDFYKTLVLKLEDPLIDHLELELGFKVPNSITNLGFKVMLNDYNHRIITWKDIVKPNNKTLTIPEVINEINKLSKDSKQAKICKNLIRCLTEPQGSSCTYVNIDDQFLEKLKALGFEVYTNPGSNELSQGLTMLSWKKILDVNEFVSKKASNLAEKMRELNQEAIIANKIKQDEAVIRVSEDLIGLVLDIIRDKSSKGEDFHECNVDREDMNPEAIRKLADIVIREFKSLGFTVVYNKTNHHIYINW